MNCRHTQMEIDIYIYIYIYIQKQKELKTIQTTKTNKLKSHLIPINETLCQTCSQTKEKKLKTHTHIHRHFKIYPYSFFGPTTTIFIYKYISSSSSSSCHGACTDIPDPLSPHSFITSGRSSGVHPISSHSCCMYVRAGRPAFAWPYVGVHRSVLASPAVTCMSGSSSLDSFRGVRQVAV